jgi:integrase
MISLKNGCSRSNLVVNPKNWKTTKASLKKDWHIMYRFYDPLLRDKYPKGKQIQIKGMNSFKELKKRQEASQIILTFELNRLDEEGFNPITNTTTQTPKDDYIISPDMPCIEALQAALERLNNETSTIGAIQIALNGFKTTALNLRLTQIPINKISRRNIIQILDYRTQHDNMSSDRRNKYVAYLRMLFKELKKIQTIEVNPLAEIEKEKTIQTIRIVLNDLERKKVNEFLRKNYYEFWRFTHIFYHSGAREAELMLLTTEKVNLEEQYFIVTIKKGKQPFEVKKPIKNIIKSLWVEVMNESKPGQYLFAKALKPGNEPINANQITRRWRTHVKDKLKINADFYSLKHLNLDEIAAELSMQDSAKMASHTTTKITRSTYAINENDRQLERLRNMNNSFA